MKISIIASLFFLFLIGFSHHIQAQTSPTLILPASQSTNVSVTPTFTWNGVPGSTDYIISVIRTQDNAVIVNTTVLGTSYNCTVTLDRGTNYSWSVSAQIVNSQGPWADRRTFTTSK
jgi:hypothetical protein